MEIKNYKIDIPVLLIFFCRPEKTKQVFDAIKEARPSKLYLYQDGARPNRPDDVENVKKCREVVADIDWDCQVFYKYQEENFGCDPSEFISQKWMFENEEYGIVLEDDDVPSQSFFPFCKELLEKYKDDKRIGIICGMNTLGETNYNDDSYFFAKSGSIWGWATWKRNVDIWDEHYTWLDDEKLLQNLQRNLSKGEYQQLVNTSMQHRNTGKAHYETILGSSVIINSMMNIIPHKNMISNIGIGENSTHATNNLKLLPKAIRKILYMKTFELNFPLRHPKYITEIVQYKKDVNRILAIDYPVKRFMRRIEGIIYRIINR
ncbi:hemolysin activation protein [Elizabethkingia miricola]|uniref:Hemolysin activation protein n=1 Tax=Elizabethkingia miricola TaxID=172045 RepID=A0ABY3NDV7_ELIMR|nr:MULTISPECIES: hemolysin activation protein [Elizabethkingia]OBS13149.1 hemolysin activation protein [Elizabethkingia miricola]TYO89750.1 hypothetical protein LX74_02742 [Elizabethkingia miricola]